MPTPSANSAISMIRSAPIPALTYEHTQNVDKVRRTLYTAEGNFNLGKYRRRQARIRKRPPHRSLQLRRPPRPGARRRRQVRLLPRRLRPDPRRTPLAGGRRMGTLRPGRGPGILPTAAPWDGPMTAPASPTSPRNSAASSSRASTSRTPRLRKPSISSACAPPSSTRLNSIPPARVSTSWSAVRAPCRLRAA